jgi:flagellar protein FliS
MFGATRSGANAYAKVGVETGVLSASPHRLTAMLYEGALTALSTASANMKAGNIAAKGKAISHAILIIDGGLRASLDKKVGGAIALSLEALYEYMSHRLLTANIDNDPAILDEVQRLLLELKRAWDMISPDAAAPEPMAPARSVAYDALAPRVSNLVRA